MGIEPSSVNVRDLTITRPDLSGPGGDEVEAPSVIASGIQATRVEETKHYRTTRNTEVEIFARFFIDPIYDETCNLVEILAGDFASWSNAFGSVVEPNEIISVEPIYDCVGRLDIVTLRVGRSRVLVE